MSDDLLIIDDGDRYGRFRLISWWRQERLLAARVLVVGAGALGNEVLKNLALLGVGHIFIVDYDTVESTNLTRSVLYREADQGRPKVERAAAAVKALNPDVKVRAWNANVITGLGLGVFDEVDVVIGCLDNREARLWINRQCWRVGKPWVDGAIQEISGTCKVFTPDSPCYECGMSEADYRLINLKYSCPLLRREDIAEGKVPTAPTISSIIAGLQTQEALKILHGMPVKGGTAMVFNGESNNFYTTAVQMKPGCLSHERYGEAEDADVGAAMEGDGLFRALGLEQATMILDRDLLVKLSCPACELTRDVGRPLVTVGYREGLCPKCHGVMLTEIVHRVDAGGPLARRPMKDLGIAPFDIVRVEANGGTRFVRLARDHAEVMQWR